MIYYVRTGRVGHFLTVKILTESGNRRLIGANAQREITQRLAKQTAFLYWREMTKTNSITMTKHYQVYPNESNENVYKHEGLFTKAQVKINKLRE